MAYQMTLKHDVKLTGIGLHSGEEVNLTIRPAREGQGIVFKRTDLRPTVTIPARVDRVVETTLATVVGVDGVTISTVEHCMAALFGMGVDNAVVEVDGPELPILDGSARLYVEAIERVGLKRQRSPRRVLRIDKPIRVESGDKFSILRPARGFSITYSIEFDAGFPGEQHYYLDVTPASFAEQLCRARTFGFVHEVEMLRKMGKARGASLDNAVALEQGGKILNPEGLRMPDELVRHKMLDAVGDMALAGWQIMGHLIVHKGGHELHRKLVAALLARPDAWTLVDLPAKESRAPTYEPRAAALVAVHV